MAFYAELLRRQWYCVCQFNAISWYSKKLYDEWWESLTDEQRDLIEKRREEKNRLETKRLMNSLLGMANIMSALYSKSCRYDKYNGMYDDTGSLVKGFFDTVPSSDE